jgi:hypothetical protein
VPDRVVTGQLDDLIVALRKLRNGRTLVVGIEGHSEAGKGFLCQALANRLAAAHIKTDSYVHRDKEADSYVGRLDLPRFNAAVQAAFGKYDFLFIDGICLRDTVAQSGLRVGAFVYCRRITEAGFWGNEVLARAKPNRADPAGAWVDWWSTDYHQREHPLERADLVYHNSYDDDADLT